MSQSDQASRRRSQERTIDDLVRRGLALHQAGHGEDAAAYYKRVLDLDRNHPTANHLLGLVRLHQGEHDTAVRQIAIALKGRPDDSQILANMGVALTGSGRNEEAVEVLRRAVSINPQFAEAYANLGRTYRLMGRFDDAAKAYGRAVELKPTEASFHYHLGNALRLAGYIFEAESAYREALRRRPNYGPAYSQLAFMLVTSARAGEALGLLDEALAILPEDAELHLQRSRALYARHRLGDAVACVDRAIELNPTCSEAHLYRARTVRHDKRDSAIDALEELFRTKDAAIDDRIFAGFGLGKALADIGDHIGSIAVFVEANKLRRQKAPFSLSREVSHMRADVDRFRAAAGGLPTRTSQDAGPIFVIGMPRAGKSTVEQVLSSHPALAPAGELPTMGRLVRNLLRESKGLTSPDLSPDRFAELGIAYLREAEKLIPPGRRVIDTMPSNYHHVGFILMALPNARIIHCVRSRGEHCVAIFEKHLTGSGFEYSNDLDDLLAYHTSYRRMMSEWHTLFPGGICDVDVAELRSGDPNAARKLLEFCDIADDGARLLDAQSEPHYQEWPADRVASNRAAHLAAWRLARADLWD